jgi:hypothetical protein
MKVTSCSWIRSGKGLIKNLLNSFSKKVFVSLENEYLTLLFPKNECTIKVLPTKADGPA